MYSNEEKRKLDEGYIELFKRNNFKWFITLTYKDSSSRKINTKTVKKDVYNLYNRLHRKFFGKHYSNKENLDKKKINMVTSIEYGGNENLHIHILLSDVENGISKVEGMTTCEVLVDIWKKKIAKEYINVDFREIYDIDNLGFYILKESGIDYSNILIDQMNI
ncbi:hypothetical protein ABN242_01285 [Providencia alcalifaciens]|uniref:rolling circle replication-associated protein n=1 Tax=Providencia alcalifaciens TaxID=126385 RepID=UPI0032DB12FB